MRDGASRSFGVAGAALAASPATAAGSIADQSWALQAAFYGAACAAAFLMGLLMSWKLRLRWPLVLIGALALFGCALVAVERGLAGLAAHFSGILFLLALFSAPLIAGWTAGHALLRARSRDAARINYGH